MQRKMINILTDRPIKINGDMYGPITTNYLETLHNIWIMVFYGVPVVEILKDGTQLPLTLDNYDKDNSGEAPEDTTPEEVPPVVTPEPEPPIEPNPEPPIEPEGDGEATRQMKQQPKRPEQPKVKTSKPEVK